MKMNNKRLHKTTVFFLGVMVFFCGTAAGFADSDEKKASRKKEPITITSDKASAQTGKHMAEFWGNVLVVQGESELKADRLTLFFNKESGEAKKGESQSPQDRIKKIIATGSVLLSMQDRRGECDRAEYDAGSDTIVLSGKKTILHDGKNRITGERIVYNRATGKIDVAAAPSTDGEAKRVKAVFFTNGKGLQ